MLPPGVLGLVFAALVAAIVASTASKVNSVATIFTMDLYRPWRPATARGAHGRHRPRLRHPVMVIAMLCARPLLGSFDQAFQYIQEFTGFFTPGICVIFLLGLFWKRASAAGALGDAGQAFLDFPAQLGGGFKARFEAVDRGAAWRRSAIRPAGCRRDAFPFPTGGGALLRPIA